MGKIAERMKRDDFNHIRELTEELRSGKRKKWVPPNSADEFDDERAVDNFKKVMDSGLTQEHIKEMKKLRGA
jgi:hypothetical protein